MKRSKDLVKFLRFLYPERCMLCRQIIPEGDKPWLCGQCDGSLTWIEPPVCPLCGTAFEGGEICADCHKQAVSRRIPNRSALVYDDVARDLIHDFKYNGRKSIGHGLAALVAAHMDRVVFQQADALVPVPLHSTRLRERGFNQALLLAGALSELIGIPVANTLIRARATVRQSALSKRERLANVSDAFQLEPHTAITGKRLLLIDDIYTSGSTVEACGGVLYKAGAAFVGSFTIAKTVKKIDGDGPEADADYKRTR